MMPSVSTAAPTPTAPAAPAASADPVPDGIKMPLRRGNRMEWLVKKDIMRIILQENGTIFGGAVRDLILHDTHANEFYSKVHGQGQEEINKLYRNPDVHPELNGRFVTPKDIDLFIHELHLPALLNRLTNENYEVKKVFEREPTDYFPNLTIEPGTIKHYRFIIYSFRAASFNAALRQWIPRAVFDEVHEDIQNLIQKMARLGCHSIPLDIMVSLVPLHEKQPEPPFGNIDFQCNALIYNKFGISISNALRPISSFDPIVKMQKLRDITDDIFHRRAHMCYVPTHFPSEYRIMKMVKKGWSLYSSIVEELPPSSDYDGYCIVCQGDFKTSKQYKLKCCDARYHIKCMRDALNIGPAAMAHTGKCVMCKSTLAWPAHVNAFVLTSCVLHEHDIT